MRGNIGSGNEKASWTDGHIYFVIAVTTILSVLATIGLINPKPDRYDEGFRAGIAAQQFTDKAVEEAAMKWWSGSPDLIGARERLCKNYYPPKGKK